MSPGSPCLPLIEARGIVKAYGGTTVLRGASFEVRPVATRDRDGRSLSPGGGRSRRRLRAGTRRLAVRGAVGVVRRPLLC